MGDLLLSLSMLVGPVIVATVILNVFCSLRRTPEEAVRYKKDKQEHRRRFDDPIWRSIYLWLINRYECEGCGAGFVFVSDLEEHEKTCSAYHGYSAHKAAYEARVAETYVAMVNRSTVGQPCSRCNGSGRSDGIECPQCDGTGRSKY